MPFFVTPNNLQKVFAQHLQSGEEALVVTMCGKRGIIAITSMQRVIRCTFPFFVKSKIKETYTTADISYCECSQIKPFYMQLNLLVRGEKIHYKSTISRLLDSKNLAKTFVAIVLTYNPNAKANYLDKDEDIVEQFATREQNIKLSQKNLFMFSLDNELESKIPLTDITHYDIYPGSLAATYFYFKTIQGNEVLLKCDTVRNQPLLTLNNNHQKVFAEIHKLLARVNPNAVPSYLNNENIITSLCAGTSMLNVIKSSHILRLTTSRLLDLSNNENGILLVNSEIQLDDIKQLRVFKLNSGYSRNGIREVKIVTKDKKKIKYKVTSEFMDEVQQLKQFINSLSTTQL